MDNGEKKWTKDKKRSRLFECDGFLNGHKVMVVFDTGSSSDGLSEKAARRSGVALTAKDQPKLIGGCGGVELARYDALSARLFIQQMTFVRNFTVIPSTLKADVLLGATWFNQFQPVFDWVHHYLFITLQPSVDFIIQADPARFRNARELAQTASMSTREANPSVSIPMDKSQEKDGEIARENDVSRVCMPEPDGACTRQADEPTIEQYHQEQKDTCLKKDKDDEEHSPRGKRKKLDERVNRTITQAHDESNMQAVQGACQKSADVKEGSDTVLVDGEGVSSICTNMEDMQCILPLLHS